MKFREHSWNSPPPKFKAKFRYKNQNFEKAKIYVIGSFEKNRKEQVRVQFMDMGDGDQFFDIRAWYPNPLKKDKSWSYKGICINMVQLPQLIYLIEKLQAYQKDYNDEIEKKKQLNDRLVDSIKQDKEDEN